MPCKALHHAHVAQLTVGRGVLRVLALPADAAKVAEWAAPLEAGLDPALLPLATRRELPKRLGGVGLSTTRDCTCHPFASRTYITLTFTQQHRVVQLMPELNGTCQSH